MIDLLVAVALVVPREMHDSRAVGGEVRSRRFSLVEGEPLLGAPDAAYSRPVIDLEVAVPVVAPDDVQTAVGVHGEILCVVRGRAGGAGIEGEPRLGLPTRRLGIGFAHGGGGVDREGEPRRQGYFTE